MNDDKWFMGMALEEADRAFTKDEVPIGCVIVDDKKAIIAKSHNLKELNSDPLGHAEVIAIRDAATSLSSWRLLGCTVYVTLEPCIMCLHSMLHARINRLVFGAYDPKGGSLSLGYHLHQDQRLNHHFSVCGGISHYKCSKLLSNCKRKKS